MLSFGSRFSTAVVNVALATEPAAAAAGAAAGAAAAGAAALAVPAAGASAASAAPVTSARPRASAATRMFLLLCMWISLDDAIWRLVRKASPTGTHSLGHFG